MIKEIRKQSGVSWDDQQCKILADPPLWKTSSYHTLKLESSRQRPSLFLKLWENCMMAKLQKGHITSPLSSHHIAQPNHNSRILEELARIKEKHQLMVRILEEKGCRLMKMLRRNGEEKEPKRRRGANGDVAAMMEKYLEIRAKQVEDERNKPRVVDEYSIKNCIDLLKTMDITPEEEVKAFRVFKIPENREIFMSARPETALMWLRAEME
ncbi:unnamed protein product [Triticum turgidum subsp. durum]|uniref:Myb/SANT-like domain-containing protein n=1 Tax=Triticum turgidum subsp. durum TaxID=4567 RepID=A0A9R0XAF1_TRITD|nr:unnamed protein product [Triticum turgidum subsp. durum]